MKFERIEIDFMYYFLGLVHNTFRSRYFMSLIIQQFYQPLIYPLRKRSLLFKAPSQLAEGRPLGGRDSRPLGPRFADHSTLIQDWICERESPMESLREQKKKLIAYMRGKGRTETRQGFCALINNCLLSYLLSITVT